MKSNYASDDVKVKRKYVFFCDPDIIVRRAETSTATARFERSGEVLEKHMSKQSPELNDKRDSKGLENVIVYHPIRPYPFNVISAIKQRHADENGCETFKRIYEVNDKHLVKPTTSLKAAAIRNTQDNEFQEKMNFMRPLEIPDLKISAKKLDFSNRDNCTSKELISQKLETLSKDIAHERVEKPVKSFERVQRKLDFSTSDVSSTINSEIEPLKVPNISISSSLAKKKEYIRENSREKENRSKRIRKDESLFSKQDDIAQDFHKRSRSPKHSIRKDFPYSSNESSSSAKTKNDRLSHHVQRENDFGLMKPKTKNFATSTAKKIGDKKHKTVNNRFSKSRDPSVESKNRSHSTESFSERSSKLSDQITVRESRNAYENFEYRYKEDLHTLKQMDERQMKQHKASSQSQGKTNISFKEQNKRSEKGKPSSSKVDSKMCIMNFKEHDCIEAATDLNTTETDSYAITLSTQQTNKDSDKPDQNINTKSNKVSEDSKYTDNSLKQFNGSNTKKEDESSTQTISSTGKQISNGTESNLSDRSLSNALLDSRRISFRDENRSPQEEFCDLVTPDMNLISRSKRRRHLIQNVNLETDPKSLKQNKDKIEGGQENIPLLHPTALHMQFQAELHLLDSFNESLRQVMDAEKRLYNVKQNQEKDLPLSQLNEQVKSHYNKIVEERNMDDMENSNEIGKTHKHISMDKAFPNHPVHNSRSQINDNEFDNGNNVMKPAVKAVEVQTQTVNDMATQTEIRSNRRNAQSRCSEICGIPYDSEVPHLSLDSMEQFEDLDQIEEISLPSKLRTMSEISLHETTSSIRTETGTEISISTRDVTCSFNKYLDLEIAQLIKDEKQRYDKIEMLFKSREKTLNDRTKKLVKLEEQKRALRDTGQESRVSSVKKKQRALLLKLQQEKDEMNRLKELHKIASQERKLMLQKQRNMFNPQMSTKNILTKLKRSADSQSPRRLSGPMKGYDIRSNSSMSSLVDSDKSQHDRSQTDARLQMSESEMHFLKLDLAKGNKFMNFTEEPNTLFLRFGESNEVTRSNESPEKSPYKLQKDGNKSKYEIKSRKFEEKMPRVDSIRLKSQHTVDPNLVSNHSANIPAKYLFEKDRSPDVSELLQQNLDKSISEHVKSESDTLVEELSKKSKSSQVIENHFQCIISPRESLKSSAMNTETVPEEISSVSHDTMSKTSKSSQISEDILQSQSKSFKRSSKFIPTDLSKKTQYNSESKSNVKRRSSKNQKTKSPSSGVLTENILRSKSNSQTSDELIKHHNKRTKIENEYIQLDKNDENNLPDKRVKDKKLKLLADRMEDHDSKENMLCKKMLERNMEAYENSVRSQERISHNFDNAYAKPQVSDFEISHGYSGEDDRNYSKFVVVRSQGHHLKTSRKLEQILNAREAALTSRKHCVEEWMAWHAKLRTEEDRVARMEQAALKLVTATSNVFSQQDTTVSSDTSDIEGRIELLTEKLAERRMEMARLKREARKQTKQKLRSFEANLLNQIKKYDTTIHEMRKKLESKKSVCKASDKLAIESRSLADFKVPEIPMKKIQDIFRNTDLLRSRSESDLLLSRRSPKKDHTKNLSLSRTKTVEIDCDSHRSESIIKPSKSSRIFEQLSIEKLSSVNRSAQSVFDETISEQIENYKIGSTSVSSISEDMRSEKGYLDTVQNVSDGKKSSISEVSMIKSEIDLCNQLEEKSLKNQISVQSDLREYKSDFETFSDESRPKTVSPCFNSNKIQDIQYPYNSSRKSNGSNTECSNDTLDFSKKLDFLHLNNQNLNEDISSLENELKLLSEMMSKFNKKTIGDIKQEIKLEEKSTSKDVSEIISNSNKSEEINGTEVSKDSKNKDLISSQKEDPQLLINSKILIKEVDNVISVITPENETKSITQEIDYKAKSKEILNVIEKSISERIKSGESNNFHFYEDDKEVSEDFSSETSKSLSEILPKSTSNKEKSFHSEEDINRSSIQKSLELGKRSSIVFEQNDPLDTDKSPNQYLDDNHSTLIGDVVNTRSVNKNDEVSKPLSQSLPKEASVVEYVNELLMKQGYSVSSSSIKTAENLQDPKEGLQINKSESVRNVESILKAKDFELSLPESKEIGDGDKSKGYIRRNDNIQLKDNSADEFKDSKLKYNSNLCKTEISAEDCQMHHDFTNATSLDKDDWTISDSFDMPPDVNSTWEKSPKQNSKLFDDDSSIIQDSRDLSHKIDKKINQSTLRNEIDDIEDVSLFLPKSESTNVEISGAKLDESLLHLNIQDTTKNERKDDSEDDTEDLKKAIYESVTKILDKVEKSIEGGTIKRKIENRSAVRTNLTFHSPDDDEKNGISNKYNLQNKILETDEEGQFESSEESTENIVSDKDIDEDIARKMYTESLRDNSSKGKNNDGNIYHRETESRGIIITELEAGSIESESLPELEVDGKVELADEEASEIIDDMYDNKILMQDKAIQKDTFLEAIVEQDSSDGEQLDNLIEVTESGLDVIKKQDKSFADSFNEAESIIQDKIDTQHVRVGKTKLEQINDPSIVNKNKTSNNERIASDMSPHTANKTFDILKDPEYEDISEESLEVSEILDKSERQKYVASQKSASIPERYEAVQKSEEVLRILDEIAQKSTANSQNNLDDLQTNNYMSQKDSHKDSQTFSQENKNEQLLQSNLVDHELKLLPSIVEDQHIEINFNEVEEMEKQEQDALSESSEDRDTPKGVPEIEMDSPRGLNDSRLNIETINDDLLNDSGGNNQNADSKGSFHATPIAASSEKDIEVMIDKLKASLDQPGMEVADWEAKLLRIQQLEIELEIKKLEAEAVSYYVREIPNKPPPPYTPPGGGTRISTSLGSPSPPPAVIPSNIEELTLFTERATGIIFKAKEAGEDIMSLEPPSEIWELTKENDETVKKDRRIYNTFLFDLCKETVAEVYQAEYEKPGASWTKPSVKTKPLMKVPRTLDELNAYVNKEVATLFGFKTKLQRENMVMRWSRKRRDRVDELLAREAQAEEAEWTKFHHDELAVKNGLTVTILDTLLMETANVVKLAYAKKRKVMV